MTQEPRTTHVSQRPRRRHLFALGLGSAGLLLLGLGLATRPRLATAGDADTADVPPGIVAFFGTADSRCPAGYRVPQEASGRLIVGVTAADAVGKAVGKALADQEDRTHVHAFAGKVELPYKSISGADGPNSQGAAAKTYADSGSTGPASSGLPFVQLTVCEKP
ncbi:MAG TPA: hypothetical protein PKI03_25870 [Pseudomonadota bacterium]|nr:hypothetical protein [Pseudomonadota bacterium]